MAMKIESMWKRSLRFICCGVVWCGWCGVVVWRGVAWCAVV